ncbi:hypothetical protein J529_3358 [Acinetobacter baumannii 99063]|uniref:Uncharacterized protein n=1 Tax=Acinetobacter baumannii 99063 TaxID=1310630 RepID=A0A009T5U4_ACIBA|nr:hypothetical protein CSB68_1421 [Acinetobacter baumannii]EXC46724.1 hypothetical protein J529_3358 [Acinetobacter baumannii 99063]
MKLPKIMAAKIAHAVFAGNLHSASTCLFIYDYPKFYY